MTATRRQSVFEIIAEPNGRAILSLLVSSQQLLREAGFVKSTVDAKAGRKAEAAKERAEVLRLKNEIAQ